MKHLILTRFNVGLYNLYKSSIKEYRKIITVPSRCGYMTKKLTIIKEDDKKYEPLQWMVDRKKIFLNYCYKSIINQTEKDFEWLIFFDKETPVKELAFYKGLENDNIKIFITNEKKLKKERLEIIKKILLQNKNDYVITTRLDNDDSLHKNFVLITKIMAKKMLGIWELPFAINFPIGYCHDTINKETRLSPFEESNPFISVVEKSNMDIKTVLQGQHLSISNKMNTKQVIEDIHYWIRIIHKHNVSNRMPSGSKVKISKSFF